MTVVINSIPETDSRRDACIWYGGAVRKFIIQELDNDISYCKLSLQDRVTCTLTIRNTGQKIYYDTIEGLVDTSFISYIDNDKDLNAAIDT